MIIILIVKLPRIGGCERSGLLRVGAFRDDRESRNDVLVKSWIASSLALLAMTGELGCFVAVASRNDVAVNVLSRDVLVF